MQYTLSCKSIVYKEDLDCIQNVGPHRRTSLPLRLGPLLSECYTMVYTLTCRHTLPCKSIVYREDLDRIQNVGPHHRTSLPQRLGPLPSECYTTTSMRTHHRSSIPLRLGPLQSKCYSLTSTYECRHTLHTRVYSAMQILTTYKMSVLSSVRTHCRASIPLSLGPLLSECYSKVSTSECGYSPCKSNIFMTILR